MTIDPFDNLPGSITLKCEQRDQDPVKCRRVASDLEQILLMEAITSLVMPTLDDRFNTKHF